MKPCTKCGGYEDKYESRSECQDCTRATNLAHYRTLDKSVQSEKSRVYKLRKRQKEKISMLTTEMNEAGYQYLGENPKEIPFAYLHWERTYVSGTGNIEIWAQHEHKIYYKIICD